MARPPRGNSNSRRSNARAKKPTTIDLEAKEIEKSAGKDSSTQQKAKSNPASKPKTTTVPQSKSATKPASATVGKNAKSETSHKSSPDVVGSTREKSIPTKKVDPAKSTGSKATPPSKPRANTGLGKLIAAGVVGGVITLLGASALQYGGILPSPGVGNNGASENEQILNLRNQISALEAKFSGGGGSQAINLEPIQTRILALENAPSTTQNADNSQIDQLNASLASLKTSTQQLGARIDNIEVAAPNSSSTNSLIDAAIAPLVSTAQQNSSKLGDLEGQFAGLKKTVDEEVNARINQFGEQLKSAATGEKLAKSVAINSLKSAVENGEPYSAAITALETLVGTTKPIAVLKTFAQEGVPTDRGLINEFQELQSTIMVASTSDPDAGIGDRLMLSIRSLVTISSDEALPGGSPQAVISRIDANLKSGNYGAAISEWRTLPDAAQQVSKSWIEKLNQRMDADRQMFKLMKSMQSEG